MGMTKLSSASPVLIFILVVVGFAGWVVYESRATPGPANSRRPRPEPPENHGPGMPGDALLAGLHPGMPRQVAERHLLPLPPGADDPVDLSSGTPVMRSHYHIHLSHPAPPHLVPPCAPHTFRPGPNVLTLEFDGRFPGHPLMRVLLAPLSPK
jgi:hypothetical protein